MDMADGGLKGAVLDDSRLRRFWKTLWGLNIPHKVRHFAWRACEDIIPTKENLLKRKVLQDGQCEACHADLESLGHIFWDCALVREVWAVSKLFPTNMMVHFSNCYGYVHGS